MKNHNRKTQFSVSYRNGVVEYYVEGSHRPPISGSLTSKRYKFLEAYVYILCVAISPELMDKCTLSLVSVWLATPLKLKIPSP